VYARSPFSNSTLLVPDLTASLLFGEHNRGLDIRKHRSLPVAFWVNGESRVFCLEQYVAFANTFVHPMLDKLFFSREDANRFLLIQPSFHNIPNHPVNQLGTVVVEVAYGNIGDIDFSDHIYWMRGVGCPKELIVCPVATRRDSNPMEQLQWRYLRHAESSGFVDKSSGNKTHLMEWPDEVDGNSVRSLKPCRN